MGASGNLAAIGGCQKAWLLDNTTMFAGDVGDEFRSTEDVSDLT